MGNKENAKYRAWLKDTLFQPLNADLKQTGPDNVIGGVGPFDFSDSAITIAAVTFLSKIDSVATESITIDLSVAVDDAAVTVTELFTAINTATPTDLTASAEAVTGRLKIVYSGAGTPTYLQIWGEAATIGLIGQGLGTRISYSNTLQSAGTTPNLKEEEQITVTDMQGIDTEIITDGYRKGVSGSFTDTILDFYMKAMFTGGAYDETGEGVYSAPTILDTKTYFKITMLSGLYLVGSSKEADYVKILKEEIFSSKGSYGDETRDRNFGTPTYNFSATSPKDTGVPTSDKVDTILTPAEYLTADYSGLDSFNE